MQKRYTKQDMAMIDQATGRVAISYRPIAELKLDPNNPRLHSPRQIRQIARSIEAFGFNVPVLVNRDLQLITGHGRILAARQLGLAQVPTIRLEHLSEAQAKAFMIADNRLTENSVWDPRVGICWQPRSAVASPARAAILLSPTISKIPRWRSARPNVRRLSASSMRPS